ncbi:protein JASON-like isoform X2 [Panicum virgatum]|uniref:protein JASON-like isoform X2 n=1 Tax=Panicum virgatum TaxID=38727 RepID=UPI0019D64C27|nr:protein JASON-like isoform X2 [Panicum virgatum]
MGCFLSCFRGGPDRSGDLQDPLVRESRLGDAFLNDEKKIEASGRLDVEAANGGGVNQEFLREANYLKSCGTISQTPPEILEVPSSGSSEETKEIDDTSINVQVMRETNLLEGNLSEVSKIDEPDKLIHEQNIDEGILRVESESRSSSQDNPSFENIIDQKTDSSDSPYPTPLVLRGDIQTPATVYTACMGTSKPVESEYRSSSQDNHSFENIIDQKTDSSDSPYPTPLVLRVDIQTPATLYTSCMGTSKPGKRARASRQFIYPVLRPIENKLQWMEVKAESPVVASNPPKRRNLSADFSENPPPTFASSTAAQTESPKSESLPLHDSCEELDEVISPEETKGQDVNQQLFESGEPPNQNSEHGKHGVSSLSYWLKQTSADDESHRYANTEDKVWKELCFEKSIFDVPIFTASGLNWDNDNPTPVLPKAWDGNGIPNTTTKYKEKVNWHATPFEERLMKVLSDEKPLHERKIDGKLIHLEENSE